jgi:hypothetical protein
MAVDERVGEGQQPDGSLTMVTYYAAIVHPDRSVTYCGEVDQDHVDEVRAVAAIQDVPRFVKEHPRQPGTFFVLRPDDEGGDLDWYVPTDATPHTVREPDADAAGAVTSLASTATAGPAYIDGAERLGKQVIGGAMDHPESGPRFTWHVTVSPQGYFTSMASYLIAAGFEPQVLYDPKSDRLGQFGPLTQSARALQNDGARRTNREGKVNIQVEVVAMPSPPWTDGFDPAAKPNFRKLLAAGRAHGIPDVWPAGPPVSSSKQAMPRTRSIWQSKAGHYGHCHVPGNTHWDPGGIDVSKVPGKATKPNPTPKPAVKYEPFPGAAWFSMGRTSPIVAAMHDRLVAVGCGKYKSSANKNVIGSGDKASYEAWQEKCGFPGDWPPGKTTWDKLKVPNS